MEVTTANHENRNALLGGEFYHTKNSIRLLGWRNDVTTNVNKQSTKVNGG